jgi:hypothetical protein
LVFLLYDGVCFFQNGKLFQNEPRDRIDQYNDDRYDKHQDVRQSEVEKPRLAVHFSVIELMFYHSHKGVIRVHQGFEEIGFAVAVHETVTIFFRFTLVYEGPAFRILKILHTSHLWREGLDLVVLLL